MIVKDTSLKTKNHIKIDANYNIWTVDFTLNWCRMQSSMDVGNKYYTIRG